MYLLANIIVRKFSCCHEKYHVKENEWFWKYGKEKSERYTIHLEDTENDMNAGMTRRDDVHADTLSEDHKVFDTEMEEQFQTMLQPTNN